MPYYDTLADDLARAKEILAKGKPEPIPELPEGIEVTGGTIYGADIYAAYKLLESFVEVIEAVDVKVCELALRHQKRAKADDVRDEYQLDYAEAKPNRFAHIPGCTCIIVNGEYRSTEVAGCPVHPRAGAAPRSITCPQCGMTSYNLNDVRQRYCGNCRSFHDELPHRP